MLIAAAAAYILIAAAAYVATAPPCIAASLHVVVAAAPCCLCPLLLQCCWLLLPFRASVGAGLVLLLQDFNKNLRTQLTQAMHYKQLTSDAIHQYKNSSLKGPQLPDLALFQRPRR